MLSRTLAYTGYLDVGSCLPWSSADLRGHNRCLRTGMRHHVGWQCSEKASPVIQGLFIRSLEASMCELPTQRSKILCVAVARRAKDIRRIWYVFSLWPWSSVCVILCCLSHLCASLFDTWYLRYSYTRLLGLDFFLLYIFGESLVTYRYCSRHGGCVSRYVACIDWDSFFMDFHSNPSPRLLYFFDAI